jgi:hypothetical protein
MLLFQNCFTLWPFPPPWDARALLDKKILNVLCLHVSLAPTNPQLCFLLQTSSNELIQFDPPELCLPLLPNQRVLSSSKMVNITDQYIGFRICPKKSNLARYNVSPSEGILPPRSMQLLLITKIAEEKELEDSQCTDKFLVWNSIVTEDVKASDVIHNMPETKCTEFPIVVTEVSSLYVMNAS